MALLMSDYTSEVSAIVKDVGTAGRQGALQGTDLVAAVIRALSTYSRLFPQQFVIDVIAQAAPNTQDVPVSSLTGYDRKFAGVPLIEFPIAPPGAQPNYLDERSWMWYPTPAGLVLRFIDSQLQPGQPARFTYNTPHHIQHDPLNVAAASNASPIQITTSTPHNYVSGDAVAIAGVVGNTAANGNWTIEMQDGTHFTLVGSVGNGAYVSGGQVADAVPTSQPAGDYRPFCKLAGAEACEVLANYYTHTNEGSIVNVDLSQFRSKGTDFSKRAKELRDDFNRVMGVDEKNEAPPAGMAVSNWDQPDSQGRDRLHHKRVYR
jgi:hypothetical protein